MQNETIITVSTASAGISFGNLLIFSDPLYLYLGIMSCVVGIVSALNDLDQLKKLQINFYAFFIVFKGAFIGFLSAPFVMFILVTLGEQIAKKIGFTIENNMIVITAEWVASLIFGRLIALIFLSYLEGKKNDFK